MKKTETDKQEKLTTESKVNIFIKSKKLSKISSVLTMKTTKNLHALAA